MWYSLSDECEMMIFQIEAHNRANDDQYRLAWYYGHPYAKEITEIVVRNNTIDTEEYWHYGHPYDEEWLYKLHYYKSREMGVDAIGVELQDVINNVNQ